MPAQQGPFILWHDNLTATAEISVPGVKATDPAALAANNAALHLKQTVVEKADAASTAAHADLNLTIGASRSQASTMIKNIKNDSTYGPVLGAKLQIEGSDDATDLTQSMPVLTVTALNGGVMQVGFPKPHAEGVHIQSKLDGQTDFSLLASATHSPFIDNRPLAKAGQPETRSYRAIYFQGKAEFGLMSAVVVATAIV